MGFAEVAEVAFANGPKCGRPFARFFKGLILVSLFVTYFGTCSVYTVIIAKNFKQVVEYQLGLPNDSEPLRLYIAALLIPLILLAWVPNLKYLAPVSMVANLLMATGLGITFYYLVRDEPKTEVAASVADFGEVAEMPEFFSITIFAMEAIGVVMPLESMYEQIACYIHSNSIPYPFSSPNLFGLTFTYRSNGNSTKLCRHLRCIEFGHVWCHLSLYSIGFPWLSRIRSAHGRQHHIKYANGRIVSFSFWVL